MMPAAKHFDPVMGVDVHIIQPPGPVPPVPVPHPFIGFIVDPFDYVPILGATVMVNGIPRTQAGTAGKCVPPHIPIGGVFVKPPANECEMFMGSATVEVDGDAFSYMSLPALSCHCIGMPPIPRPKKKSKTKSLVMPTSMVLPIPAGPPVIVGGPPTISLMAMGMKVGMAALGKGFKRLSKTKAFKKAKGKLDDVKSKFKKKKKGRPASNTSSCEGGCPVDAITGAVVDRLDDYHLPGALSLRWRRYYDSRWTEPKSPLGPGWRHEFQRTLEATPDGFLFVDASGEEFELPPIDPDSGVSVWAGLELSRTTATTYRIRRREQAEMEFELSSSGGPAPLSRLSNSAESVRLDYDQNGHLVALVFSNGQRIRTAHDAAGHITAAALEQHGATRTLLRYEYSEQGTLIRHMDALGHATEFDYDAQSRLVCKRDALGYEIRYQYDESGRCIRTWGQDGLYDEHFEYHPDLRQSVRRSATGAEWTFTYDEDDVAVELLDPYGECRSFVLDDLGRVVADIDEIGQETQLLYDQQGEHYARRTPLGDLQPPRHVDLHPADRSLLQLPNTPLEWQWGGLLPPHRIKNQTGRSTTQVTDAMGRVTEQTDHRGRTQRWTFDPNGNVVAHTDVDGHVQRTEIGSWNLARRKIDASGRCVEYDYNIHEYLTKIVDPAGAVSEYLYDLKDRLEEVRRHGLTRERYRWDAAGNLIQKQDGNGRVLLNMEIGEQGLPVKRELSSGEVHEFDYDHLGYVTRTATQSSETAFVRDGAGRALADQRDGLGTAHTLAFGHISETIVFDKFRTEFDFDFDGNATITDPTGQVHRLQCRRDGRVQRTLANGTSETNTFDDDGHVLLRLRSRRDGSSVQSEYRYSPAGDLVERIDDRGTTTFEYDAAHRLTAEVSATVGRRDYTRDAAGNLLNMPGLYGVRLLEGNRLTEANSGSFTYNDRNHIASRRSAKHETHYEYDAKDMLVQAMIDGEEWTAEYDPLGRRIRKSWCGGTTEFYWDDKRLAAEVRPDGSCRIYIYPDLDALVPIMFIDYQTVDADPESGLLYHLFVDQRGCPEVVEDAFGKTVWQAHVDPYGTAHVNPSSEIELNLRMPGHYYDSETGLHYNRFRYYSPDLGRYLQSDPIGQSGGYNLYAYCHNPLTHVDIVGWDHSNDVGGSKKSGDAESPSPAKKGDADGVEAVAAKGGMDPGHLKNLQKHCDDNNRMVVMRAGNDASVPHIKDPNGRPKGVDCKLNAAKSGDNAGKVTTGQSPQKWKPEAEGGSGYKENLDNLKKDGYTVEDGVLKDPDGKYVHSDYDMQGAYDKGPDGKYGPPTNKDGKPYDGGTNDPEFQREVNNDLNDPANYDGPPDKDMVQHGANDDYKNADGSPGRTPGDDENYVVVDEDGTAHYVEGTDNLKNMYDEKGIPWPY